jgi:trimeric autotransporter adhesin
MLDRSLFGTNAANFGFEVPTNPTEPTVPTTPNGSIVPNIDPSWDVTQAYDLGGLTDSLIVQESVGGNDIGDLYQFTVGTTGEYSFTLDGLSANADLLILNSNGELLAISENTDIAEEMLNGNLDAGTYYIGVGSLDGTPTDYTLNLTNIDGSEPTAPTDPTVPINPTTDPGETSDTAFDLGIFNDDNSITVRETIGINDRLDVYQFSVEQSSDFSVIVDGLDADLDLFIWNSNNEAVGSSITNGITEEGFSATIESGTYFVGVAFYSGADTSYDLTISTGASNPALSSPEMDIFPMSDELSFA